MTLSQENYSLQSVNTFRIDGKVLANCRAQIINCEVNNCELSDVSRGCIRCSYNEWQPVDTVNDQGVNLGRSNMYGYVHNTSLSMEIHLCSGNCVTGVSSADVCGVNSTSLECSGGGFTASSCICQPEALNNSKCQLTGELS